MRTFEEFQTELESKFTYPVSTWDKQLTFLTLGLTASLGRAVEEVQVAFYFGDEVDEDKLRRELRDVLAHLSLIASAFEIPLEDLAKEYE